MTSRRHEPRDRVNPPFRPFERSWLDRSLHACFSHQVREHRTRVAVRDPSGELTYAALDDQANWNAGRLLDGGSGIGARTALLLPQSSLLTSAILAVLKTGGSYVPLDPSRPTEWNAWLIADADCERLLYKPEDEELARAIARANAQVMSIEALADGSRPAPVNVEIPPNAMACIYYTSGSTGRPKGVCDSHRNVLHNVMRYTNSLNISANDRLSLIQSPVFSGTLSSLFGALLNGASLACMDLRERGLDTLAEWVCDEDVTIYHSVPSIFRSLCVGDARYPRVRLVRLEGDQASSRDFELFRRHFRAPCRLVNGLGSTECGLVRQHFLNHASDVGDGVLPLGSAVQDMEILILDEHGEAVAPGMVGEIAVRSRYLALGYWGNPVLTAARFEACDDGSGERVYRTGDLGSLNGDGVLAYRGRQDQQFKIDGQRIDLAHVEALLQRVPGVADAVAGTRADDPGQPRLVAYLLAAGPSRPSLESIRAHLAARLPTHMIPSKMVWLDRIPLSADGKVDRKALPAPPEERPALETDYAPPRSGTELRLVQLWEELLGVAPVGIDDNFLDLGGTSLLAIMFLDRLQSAFDARLSLGALFDTPTIEKLARRIDDATRRRMPTDPPTRGGS